MEKPPTQNYPPEAEANQKISPPHPCFEIIYFYGWVSLIKTTQICNPMVWILCNATPSPRRLIFFNGAIGDEK